MNQRKHPHILFYLVDDQDRDDYGCYGNDKVHSPAVDRLSREGLRFTRCYTGQAICAPSRSILFTGCHPLKNGVYMNHRPLRKGQQSLIPTLQQHGYRVILAGKSHVGPDEAFPWDAWWQNEDSTPEFGGTSGRLPIEKIRTALQESPEPLCIMICSSLPHPPYPQMPAPRAEELHFDPGEDPSDPACVQKLAGYYENIRRDNEQLEQVLQAVDDSPDPEQVLFIYSADHGASKKYTLYDGGLNVALVMRWPGQIPAGVRSDALISFTDLFPSLLELSGAEIPDWVDGRSFASSLADGVPSHRDYCYGIAEHQNILMPSVFPSRMICDGRWKYIRNFNAYEIHEQNLSGTPRIDAFIRAGAEKFRHLPVEELYDLQADPHEQKNLAHLEEHGERKQHLHHELQGWMSTQSDYLLEEGPLPLFRPNLAHLDRPNPHYQPPAELAHSLLDSDYRDP